MLVSGYFFSPWVSTARFLGPVNEVITSTDLPSGGRIAIGHGLTFGCGWLARFV
ncbi:hypothetical protein [Streptomyces sp. NPDC059371]|uniref:hypothetical protein n=1 Tax=Streptomyces sp. NPDC059371 TaxID=3346812 RepID=UPI00368A8ADA